MKKFPVFRTSMEEQVTEMQRAYLRRNQQEERFLRPVERRQQILAARLEVEAEVAEAFDELVQAFADGLLNEPPPDQESRLRSAVELVQATKPLEQVRAEYAEDIKQYYEQDGADGTDV